MNRKASFIGRTWQTFNVGYGLMSAPVSLLGWTSIVGYVIARYLPSGFAWGAYLIIPGGVGIAALIIGHIL